MESSRLSPMRDSSESASTVFLPSSGKCSASVRFDPSDNFCGCFECYTRNIIQREHKQSWIGCRQVRSFRYKASIVPSVSTKAINPNNTTSCGESVSMDLCSTAGGEI